MRRIKPISGLKFSPISVPDYFKIEDCFLVTLVGTVMFIIVSHFPE